MQKLTFALLLAVIFISCNKTDDSAKIERYISNVPYGADPAQVMDIYLPPFRSVSYTKVVILIHGGGWTAGDKSDLSLFADTLKKRLPGYAIFNINYRLSANPLNLFPTQEMDVKSAVQFIFSKSKEFHLSGKYVMIGVSAGAHLAMLHSYKYNTPVKIKTVVSYFGPSDLTDMYNNPVGGNTDISTTLATAIGASPSQNQALYTASSPINFINSTSAVPTILIHGGLDPLVSPSQSSNVQAKMIMLGIPNQFVYYPAGGHGNWDAATYTDSFNNIQSFIYANVQ